MVRVKKLTSNICITLHRHSEHRQQQWLSKFLMRSLLMLIAGPRGHFLRWRCSSERLSAKGDNNPLACPTRSPDLTPWYFFLWEFVKDSVYVPPLTMSLKERSDRITHSLQAVTAEHATLECGMNLITLWMCGVWHRVHTLRGCDKHMRNLDSCCCWRCELCPCEVKSKFLVNFWNRTILLCILT